MPKKEGGGKKKTPHWPSYARALKRRAKDLNKSESGDFTLLIEEALSIEDPYYSAMALSWISRRMMELGLDGKEAFSKAIEAVEQVPPGWRRSEITIFVEKEISKTGAEELLGLIKSVKDSDYSEIVHTPSYEQAESKPKIKRSEDKTPGNIVFGLFNTYEGKKLKDAHIRAVARAAPLCVAYGFKLGLFNFPFKDSKELKLKVENQTLIRDVGKYIRILIENNWLLIMDSPSSSFLADDGVLIVTTSKPDMGKKTSLEEALKINAPCFYFLIGLGSGGLPKKILRLSKYHVELTGGNISLETCTAMGVLAAKLDITRPR
jgi:hypothetical protein